MMEVISVLALLSVVAFASVGASAAPHRNRATMERSRRATNEENELWANPCDYADGSSHQIKYRPVKEIASKLAKSALWAYRQAYSYREQFAKLHSHSNFSALLSKWEFEDWLRKTYPDALPEEKLATSPDYIDYVSDLIYGKMPSMYMALKMVVAGLYRFSEEGLNANLANDDALKENISQTMHDTRAVLCYFDELMRRRELEISPLLDKDLPNFTNDPSFGLLLYRDTLYYLDYLVQFFSKAAEKI